MKKLYYILTGLIIIITFILIYTFNNENKNNESQNIQSENKTTQNNKTRLKPRDVGETRKGIFLQIRR